MKKSDLVKAVNSKNAIMSLRSLKRSSESILKRNSQESFSAGQLFYGHHEENIRESTALDNINKSIEKHEAILLDLVGGDYVENTRNGIFGVI